MFETVPVYVRNHFEVVHAVRGNLFYDELCARAMASIKSIYVIYTYTKSDGSHAVYAFLSAYLVVRTKIRSQMILTYNTMVHENNK